MIPSGLVPIQPPSPTATNCAPAQMTSQRISFTALECSVQVAPSGLVKLLARRYAETLQWIEQNNEPYIEAFFGTREAWEKIPDWNRN